MLFRSVNQHHSQNDGQLGKLNSNCTSLLCRLATYSRESSFTSACWTQTSIPSEVRGGAKDYDRALDSFSDNFKHRTKAPMARQTFLAAKPLAGETINNLLFVCRNSKCVYEAERANQVRDRASSFYQGQKSKGQIIP